MKKLLLLKHWQLFFLFIGLPIILQIIFLNVMIYERDPGKLLFPFMFIMVIFMAVFFGWFYALGTNLHKKLPPTVKMNIGKFKLFMIIPIVYIIIFILFVFNTAAEIADGGSANNSVFLLIFPLHLFCMFCLFYCLYFNAKSLKAVEWQRPVTFSDFSGEFFMLWFFPFGVWILQPRINNIFAENPDLPADGR